MKDKAVKTWVCDCGEHNTDSVCAQCGKPQGERKPFSLCPECEHVYFSDTHQCPTK